MKNKFTLSLAVALICLGSSAFAGNIRVEDPSHVLEWSDQFIGAPDFLSAFKLGDETTIEFNRCETHCSNNSCHETCQTDTANVKVTMANADFAKVTSVSNTGESQSTDVPNGSYQQFHGNALRFALYSIHTAPAMAAVSALMVHERDYLSIDGANFTRWMLADGKTLDAMRVQATIYAWMEDHNSYFPIDIQFVIGKQVPAISQLLEMRMWGMSRPAFQVRGFSRH